MFSYRHAFHAGNHADVLKHFVLVQLLAYLNQKDTPYTYIDTHSGAGVYALDDRYAAKTGEYETGIGKLWSRNDLPPALAEYVGLVRAMNPSGTMRYYPGSPYVAEQVARDEDRLRLFEMHPADVKHLADNFRKLEEHAAHQGKRPSARGKRVIVERSDGFASLKALLPPPSRRALVLIDPPYEDKNDYRYVKDALDGALARFGGGVYAVWYPLLQRMESRQFADRLKRVQCKDWLNVTLTISTPGPDGVALHSSGMFVLNPPYTLEATLRSVMPYLVKVLGVDAGASFRIETGTPVTGAGERTLPDGRVRTPRNSPIGKGSLRVGGATRVPGQAPSGDRPRGEGAPRTQGEEGRPRTQRGEGGPHAHDGKGEPRSQRGGRAPVPAARARQMQKK